MTIRYQSEIGVETKWGIYATIWHSTDFDSDPSGDYGDELDYYLGWAGNVGPVSLDVGFSYFDAIELFRGAKDDTFYLYARVGKTFESKTGSYTPFLKGNLYINGRGSEVEGGTVVTAGLEYEPPLPIEWLSLPARFQIGYDDGAFGNDNGFISGFALEANWQVSERFSITAPILQVSIPLTTHDERETEWVIGGGIVFNF